ncbi:MAG TPA: hypothetical protein VFU19_01545 [Iamia sp.]|nr:hypothetical protein [Iamia sp.]
MTVDLTKPGEAAADEGPPSPDRPIPVGEHVRNVLLIALRRIGGTSWQTIATGVVVTACALFVFETVQPAWIFKDNTPTGGDMGSHVWGPMFLMREALPHGQLNAWAPDWYAGFPAFQFYMVVPMLLIVVVHVGVRNPLIVLSLPVVLGLIPLGWFVPRLHRYRWGLFGAGTFLTVLVVPVPYGVAFKLVAVSGLVGLPIAAWALGRLAGAPFPIPPALALGSLFFIYNLEPTLNSGTGNIIGGNLTSTMAGEFSFSISLTLSLLYLGFLIRGLRTGKGRGTAGVLLALCGLCHIIPAFYVIGATAVALVVWPGRNRLRWFLPVGPVAGLLSAFWVLPFAGRHAYVNDMGWEPLPHVNGGDTRTVWAYVDTGGQVVAMLLVGLVLAAALVAATRIALEPRWRGVVTPIAGLTGLVGGGLVAFWVLSQVTAVEAGLGPAQTTTGEDGAQTIFSYLLPKSDALDLPLLVAGVGLVVGIVFQQRLAYLLAAMTAGGALGFVVVPDGRLWNARLLPLYYLALFLLAALGVGEVLRALSILLSRDPERPTPWVGIAAAVPATLAVLIFLGGPLSLDQLPWGVTNAKGEPELAGIARTYTNPGSGWAEFNFKGLEGQPAKQDQPEGAAVPNGQGGWPEFRDMVATMDELGQDPDHGCGRAFWEFNRDRLQSYGTTMAPMMLPYFTDGCIGSMEGLYFESSATTPYHFITQCKLSQAGSCSQRDLAYTSFDIANGIEQLELMGVKYYMASSQTAVDAASRDDRLTEVAVSGPWHVYELQAQQTRMVVGLDHLPVVLEGVEPVQDSWLDPAIAWFNDPERWDIPFAIDGPADWPRVDLPEVPDTNEDGTDRRVGDRELPEFPAEQVRPAAVSDVEVDAESLSFEVDQPGTPVLVKVSYFPNWKVEGAEGPYRVAPNLMVVVPTDTEVTMTYGRTPLDWAAYLLTFLGIIALIGFWRFGPVPIPEGLLDRRRRQRTESRAAAAAAATRAAALTGPPEVVPPDSPWPAAPTPDTPPSSDPPPSDPPPSDPPAGDTASDLPASGDADPGGAASAGGPSADPPPDLPPGEAGDPRP